MNLAALQAVLNDINDSTRQLLSCLDNELKALNDKQYETLLTLADEKQRLVEQLNALDRQRQQFHAGQNFSDYLKQQDASGRLTQDWQLIREQMEKCQQQNSVNGRLLQRYYRLSQETMSLLTGRSPDSDATYGRDGLQQGKQSLLSGTRV